MDSVHKSTIEERGTKSVSVVNTNSDKTRYTAALTIDSSGVVWPAYVVFRGLKKPPKCPAPNNIIVSASSSGTMDTNLMLDYIARVLKPQLQGRRALLLLDQHTSHYTPPVLNALEALKVQVVFVPGNILFKLFIL